MSATDAAAAFETAQRAVFLQTAHPFMEPSYLDIAKQVPGWAAVFTDGYTGAMVVFAAIALFGAAVAWLGLRDSSEEPAGAAQA